MTDEQLIQLLLARDEVGLDGLRREHGRLGLCLAQRIVGSSEDAEECVQDALLAVWNSVPPTHPKSLKQYFLRLVRNRALDLRRSERRQKRGGGEITMILEELDRDIPSTHSVEDAVAEKQLAERIDVYLGGLPRRERIVFLRRYYYMEDTETIAAALGLSTANVSVILFRTRKKLKVFLKKEGLL